MDMSGAHVIFEKLGQAAVERIESRSLGRTLISLNSVKEFGSTTLFEANYNSPELLSFFTSDKGASIAAAIKELEVDGKMAFIGLRQENSSNKIDLFAARPSRNPESVDHVYWTPCSATSRGPNYHSHISRHLHQLLEQKDKLHQRWSRLTDNPTVTDQAERDNAQFSQYKPVSASNLATLLANRIELKGLALGLSVQLDEAIKFNQRRTNFPHMTFGVIDPELKHLLEEVRDLLDQFVAALENLNTDPDTSRIDTALRKLGHNADLCAEEFAKTTGKIAAIAFWSAIAIILAKAGIDIASPAVINELG